MNGILTSDIKIEVSRKSLTRFILILLILAFTVLIFPEAKKVNSTIIVINVLLILMSSYFIKDEQKIKKILTPVVLSKAVLFQIIAQLSIYVYWGIYNQAAIKRMPLVIHQVIFGYLFLFLLSCWLNKKFKVSFSPTAAILSANLFIWFSPKVYFFHYVLIVIALLGKTFITRNVNGEEKHIFNPSGFVSNIAAVTICLLQINYIHEYVYATQMGANFLWMPHFDLVVFLASCLSLWSPNMYMVAIGAISTMWIAEVLSIGFFGKGFTTETPRGSILLGIALLITDPATAPRSKTGQFFYGAGYAFTIFGSFIILAYKEWHMYFVKVFLIIPLNFFAYKFDELGVWAEKIFDSKLNSKIEFNRFKLLSLYVLLTFFTTITLFGRRLPPYLLDFQNKVRLPMALFEGADSSRHRIRIGGILSPRRFYYVTRMIMSGREYRMPFYQSPTPLNSDFDQFTDEVIR